MLRLPGGGERWPLLSSDDIGRLLAVAPIRHYQFAQTHLDRLEVRLQTTRPLDDGEARRVVEWAHAKFGSGFRIELTYPTTLALSAAGKFEDFVCLI